MIKDLPSARHPAEHGSTPIVRRGFEIGLNLRYPHESIQRDFAYVEHHPVAEAYLVYNPAPHNRPTWGLTSILHAIRPDHHDLGRPATGRVSVDQNGLTSFTPSRDGRDRYLILDEKHKERATEAIVQLTSRPPLKR